MTTVALTALAVAAALLAAAFLTFALTRVRRSGHAGFAALITVWGWSFITADVAYAAVLATHLGPPTGRRVAVTCSVLLVVAQILVTRLLFPDWVELVLDSIIIGVGSLLITLAIVHLVYDMSEPGTSAYGVYVCAAALSLALLVTQQQRSHLPRPDAALLRVVMAGRLVGALMLVLVAKQSGLRLWVPVLVLAASYLLMLAVMIRTRDVTPERSEPHVGRLWFTAPPLVVLASTPVVLGGIVLEAELRRPFFLFLCALVSLAVSLRQHLTTRTKELLLSRLAEGEQLYRSLIQDSSDVTLIASPAGILEYVSPAAHRVLGQHPADLAGRSASDVLAVPRIELSEASQRVLSTGVAERLESRPAVGGMVLESVLSRFEDRLLINVRDMTERAEMRERLQRMAYHDELTGLPNWHRVNAEIGAALAEWNARSGSSEPALLFVDLDRFKSVNDAAGHAAGDAVLRVVADRLRTAVPAESVLGRVGGDEFVVLLRGLAVPEPERVADEVVRLMAQPIETDHGSFAIGASVGIALASGARDPNDLLRHADLAMYKAKRDLRPWHRYDPGLHTVAVARAAMDRNYSAILDQEHLVVMFQPVVSLATGALVSCEALLRWRDPEGRLGEPQGLLDYAARTGRMYDVATWVLRATLDEALRWRSTGYPAVPVAVNLSSGDVLQPGLAELVRSELASRGLPPNVLSLEITEQVLLADPVAAMAVCEELRGIGVVVAIDDFGTGFSSLAYLVDLPVDILKIDQTFTRSLDRGGSARVIFASIVHMARELGLLVVAEGIETDEQRALASSAGVQYGQGYLFAGLLTGDELGALAARSAVPPGPASRDRPIGPLVTSPESGQLRGRPHG